MILILFILPGYLLAQPDYTFQYPFSQSAEAGSDFHLLLHREISACRDYLLPSRVFSNNSFLSEAGNVTYRLLMLGSMDFYLAYLPVVNQHEYFGHLGRAKQLDAGFTRYQIYFFPPTGGRAYWGDHRFHQLTNAELMLEIAGGIEANSVLAGELGRKVLQKGKINFHESMLLLGAGSDLVTYLLFEEETSYNDIDQYLQIINQDRMPGENIEKSDLIWPATISFITNPLMMHAIYNLTLDYISRGRTVTTLLLFNGNGRISFIPYAGYALTPTGPVLSLNSYFISGDNQYKISVGHGFPWNIRHAEVGISAYRIHILPESLVTDLDIRGWVGDGFPMHDQRGNIIPSGKIGGLASLDLYCRLPVGSFNGRVPLVMAGVYVKTLGYSAGYMLQEGIGFKIGAGYFFVE